MKLRGWVAVYSSADGTIDRGYFMATSPLSADNGQRVYTFEVDVPDIIPVAEAEVIEGPGIARPAEKP